MRRKHLCKKEDRVKGYCQTSLWGPFCDICREKFSKELTEKLKNIDWSKIKFTQADLDRIKKESEATRLKFGPTKPLGTY